MKIKTYLCKALLPIVLVVLFLFNLTACSNNRFMRQREYLRGAPEAIVGELWLGVNGNNNTYRTFKLRFELYYYEAPITVTNFINLIQEGLFDYEEIPDNEGKEVKDMAKPIMHRLVKQQGFFLLQGGGYRSNPDPYYKGDILELKDGGFDYYIKGEFSSNGWEKNSERKHLPGTLSMARLGGNRYDTASSEFFISLGDTSGSNDGEYAVFGRIVGHIDGDGEYLDGIPGALQSLKDIKTKSETFNSVSVTLSDYPENKIEIVYISIDTSWYTRNNGILPKALHIPK